MAATSTSLLTEVPTPALTIGALLLGWGISSLVLGALLVQARIYFLRYPKDNPYYKGLVVSLLLLETLHQCLVGHTAWYYNVQNLGSPRAFFHPPVWSLSVQVVLGALVGAIVKICYGLRVWKFSCGNIWVTGFVLSTTLAQLGCAFAFTVHSLKTPLINAGDIAHLASSTLALGTVTDVATACALSYFLHKLRTGYSRSDTLVDRLIVHSINTGMITSLVSLTVLILYNVMPMNFAFMAVYFVLAKLYSISCLATLNSRRFVSGKGTENDSPPSPSSILALSPRSKYDTRLEVEILREVSVISEPNERQLRTSDTIFSASSDRHRNFTTGW